MVGFIQFNYSIKSFKIITVIIKGEELYCLLKMANSFFRVFNYLKSHFRQLN